MAKIVVYGWYHQSNLGDDLFEEVIPKILPDYTFEFTNHLTEGQIASSDAVFFGGGSFLDEPIAMDHKHFPLLLNKPIIYIGVGMETQLHSDHKKLLGQAKLVIPRSLSGVGTFPDLVYAAPRLELSGVAHAKRRVLFIPNVSVLPKRTDPHWEHAAWNYFKSECSQFLDDLIQEGSEVRFLNACRSTKLDDNWASNEILSQMVNRERNLIIDQTPSNLEEALRCFSSYSVVITQRFHGVVLSDLSGVPVVPIAHHDKLNCDRSLSYYGMSKKLLRGAVESAKVRHPLESNIEAFETVRRMVQESLSGIT